MRFPIAGLIAGLALCCSTLTSAAGDLGGDEAEVDLWQLYQKALEADPRILKADAQIRGSAGREREAFGQLLPQLVATGSVNRSRRDDALGRTEYDGERYTVSLSQVLYDPQVWRSYRKFAELTAQSEFAYEDVRTQASIDLVERYFLVLAAEDELALVRAERQATERNLARINSLFARQMAMVTDVLELQARLDALQADEIEALNQVEVSREAIAELVGHEVRQPFRRRGDQPAFTLPAQRQEYWLETALATNPALQARRRALHAASAALGEARAGHLPSLVLDVSAQRSDIGYEGSLTPRSDAYVATLAVQLPLYGGGSTRARAAAAYADMQVAEQDYEALRRQVVREARTAFWSMEAGLARIRAMRRAQESAEKSRLAAEKAFEHGMLNAVEVLDRVQEEFRARRDLAHAQYAFITSLLVLHRWGGQLTDNDIRKVNDWLVGG